MTSKTNLTCRCGAVRIGVAVPRRSSGTRLKCYCVDCQTSAHALGADEILDVAGGLDIWHTTPDLLTLQAGAEHLAVLRLSPKGTFRWYAACCDTPICITATRLAVPFLGLVLCPDEEGAAETRWEADFGPVRARVNTVGARPGQGAPVKDSNFLGAGVQIAKRMATAALAGRAKSNPLRAADGGPIGPIRVLTKEERLAAHP